MSSSKIILQPLHWFFFNLSLSASFVSFQLVYACTIVCVDFEVSVDSEQMQ